MTREELLRALLVERFGPVKKITKERPPTPLEMTKRRLVLIGIDPGTSVKGAA